MRLWRRTTPWSVELDRDWRSTRFTVIDVETTGLDLRRDEIVSIGAVDIEHGRVDAATAWYQPVQPTCEITLEALKIHSLTRDELAAAPQMPMVIDRLSERLRGSVLVAHAAWIERAFLDRALKPLGERLPAGVVDTAGLARAAGLWEAREREPNLELLARQLRLPVFTPHHALGDAMTTAVVLLVLAARLEEGGEAMLARTLVDLGRSGG